MWEGVWSREPSECVLAYCFFRALERRPSCLAYLITPVYYFLGVVGCGHRMAVAPLPRTETQCADTRSRDLGLVGIFEDLNQNLPARAARENLRKFACLRAVTRRSNVELSTR
jgi:hypothetical protein